MVDYEYDTLEAFFKSKLQAGKCGFLVYVSNSELPHAIVESDECGIEHYEVNCTDLNILKDVGVRCLFVTDDEYELMRGTDYRSSIPLHLLITEALPNQRAFK